MISLNQDLWLILDFFNIFWFIRVLHLLNFLLSLSLDLDSRWFETTTFIPWFVSIDSATAGLTGWLLRGSNNMLLNIDRCRSSLTTRRLLDLFFLRLSHSICFPIGLITSAALLRCSRTLWPTALLGPAPFGGIFVPTIIFLIALTSLLLLALDARVNNWLLILWVFTAITVFIIGRLGWVGLWRWMAVGRFRWIDIWVMVCKLVTRFH